MAEKKERAVGWGKQVTSWKRGVSICLDDLQNFATKSDKNNKFYVRLNIVDLKEPNQYGKDVAVEIDPWKPDGRKSTTEVPQKYHGSQKPNTPENFVDDSGDLAIPF